MGKLFHVTIISFCFWLNKKWGLQLQSGFINSTSCKDKDNTMCTTKILVNNYYIYTFCLLQHMNMIECTNLITCEILDVYTRLALRLKSPSFSQIFLIRVQGPPLHRLKDQNLHNMSQNSTNGSKNCRKIIDIFQKKGREK